MGSWPSISDRTRMRQGGSLSAVRDQFDNEVTIRRSPSGDVSSFTSPDGVETTLRIVDGDLVEVQYPGGLRHQFEYSSGGLMTVEIEPNGDRYDHVFDEMGRLLSVEDLEGGRWGHYEADTPHQSPPRRPGVDHGLRLRGSD